MVRKPSREPQQGRFSPEYQLNLLGGFFMETSLGTGIDQGIELTFEENYIRLAQQEESFLTKTGACFFVPSEGYAHNIARMGRAELTQVTTRNPKLVIEDYNLDNRQFTMKRFTKTFRIDEKDDINELIADPTSDLIQTLVQAGNRTQDREVARAAVGSVLVGAPNEAMTETSAADDGVVTVSALSGIGYDTIQTITENFINNDVPMDAFKGSTMAVAGKENTDLMGITQFISNDFISGRVVDEGYMDQAGMYQVVQFAGSRNGGITVPNPVLVESATQRKCIVLAPNSIAVSIKLNKLEVKDAPGCVASKDVTIDMWIRTMRVEGVKVQIILTTI